MPASLKTNLAPLQSSLSALLAGFGEEQYLVKLTAAEALGRIGGEDAVQGLIQALKHETDPRIRARAATALGEALVSANGKVSAELENRARDSLLAAKSDSDQEVGKSAAQSLQVLNLPRTGAGPKKTSP